MFRIPAAGFSLALLLCVSGAASAQTRPSGQFSFSTIDTTGLPTGWRGNPRITLSADSGLVHSEPYAVRIERTAQSSGSFSVLSIGLPLDLAGDTLELRGWLRTSRVVGYAGMWLREDAASGTVQLDNMEGQNLKGTTPWTQYTIKLPLEHCARTVVLGALLAGSGTLWVDDLDLLVDGRPLAEAPARSAGPATAQPGVMPCFQKRSVMIPMRDGARLRTDIMVPELPAQKFPILLERSPYPLGYMDAGQTELARDGYIFVSQYIRGRYGSEGQFRQPEEFAAGHVPHRSDPGATDESTDAYDTIEWLVHNVPESNGRVGVMGVSYDGWLALMASVDPHPALAAASPQASPADLMGGDDWIHNGAFRLAPSYYYSLWMAGPEMMPVSFDQADTYDWFLDAGTLAAIRARSARDSLPLWDILVAHPNRDEYVERQDVVGYLDRPEVPTLNVGGFWDAEDFSGAVRIYEALERKDSAGLNFLLLSPWRHGGWSVSAEDGVANILTAGNRPALDFHAFQRKWFAHFLKGEGASTFPGALVYQTGSNRWESYDVWPPASRVTQRRLFLRKGGLLSFDSPPADQPSVACDSYISDPANPVPYTKRPISGFWATPQAAALWKVEDQRFLAGRPDVLSWQTEPLTQEVTVTGRVAAHLFAATTGTDSDWVVKLIDVYPEPLPENEAMAGYQLMIADEVMRAKFRDNRAIPQALTPDEVREYVIDLDTRNHRFRAGHRIMVQVQSSWFPLIDRNPQTFVNIPTALATDFRKATQRVCYSRMYPSHLSLTVSCADRGAGCRPQRGPQ